MFPSLPKNFPSVLTDIIFQYAVHFKNLDQKTISELTLPHRKVVINHLQECLKTKIPLSIIDVKVASYIFNEKNFYKCVNFTGKQNSLFFMEYLLNDIRGNEETIVKAIMDSNNIQFLSFLLEKYPGYMFLVCQNLENCTNYKMVEFCLDRDELDIKDWENQKPINAMIRKAIFKNNNNLIHLSLMKDGKVRNIDMVNKALIFSAKYGSAYILKWFIGNFDNFQLDWNEAIYSAVEKNKTENLKVISSSKIIFEKNIVLAKIIKTLSPAYLEIFEEFCPIDYNDVLQYCIKYKRESYSKVFLGKIVEDIYPLLRFALRSRDEELVRETLKHVNDEKLVKRTLKIIDKW